MIQKLTNTTRTLSLVLVGLVVCCFASVRPSVAQDVAFYPDLRNETKIVERAGRTRDYEVAPFGDGVLFLTDTELVFASWDTVTLLKSGLSTPKHLFVVGDHYYFAEGSKLYRGIGFAQPTAVLTHSTQIDEIFYGDAQHKELAFISLDRPGAGNFEQELYIFSFESGVASDQEVGVSNWSTNFSGYEPRVQRRFLYGYSSSLSRTVLIGFRDVASGVVATQLISSGPGWSGFQFWGRGTADSTFFSDYYGDYFVSLTPGAPSGFSLVSFLDNPQKDLISAVYNYDKFGPAPIQDPHHEGYLGFRFNDSGATILTRFTTSGYQDVADVSSFVPGSLPGNALRLKMGKHRGEVFFYNPSISDVLVRLMPDDTLVSLAAGDSTPLNKSLANIALIVTLSIPFVVESGDFVYEENTGGGDLRITKRILDQCPASITKSQPGQCGCSAADTDTDGDGSADCVDECDSDPAKHEAGSCGCGFADTDANSNGTADCNDVDSNLRRPTIMKVQRKVWVAFPKKAGISYRYTYKFLDKKNKVLKLVGGRANSGKQLKLDIPKRASKFSFSFLAKGPGYKDYRSPYYKKAL